jgi:hypothetical protein
MQAHRMFVPALIETGVQPVAHAIQMTVDLITLLLKFVSQAIFALLCSTGRFLVEVILYAIPFNVQALINTLALRNVTVEAAVAITAIGDRRAGKKQQEECQGNGNNLFHGFVLSRESECCRNVFGG